MACFFLCLGWRSNATFNFADSNHSSPLLIPYPDWSSNNVSSRFLVSTYRVKADRCDRLWTIDTGSVIDFQGVGERLNPPRIRIFNLQTNSLLLEYTMKAQDYVCDSTHTNIVVDLGSSCDDAFAYVVDPSSHSIFVYSLQANDSWRIQHPYFLPDPLQSDYSMGNLQFQWFDGIFGIALTETNKYGFRNVFAHPMSSLYELITTTQQLRNQSTWRNSRDSFGAFHILGSRDDTFQAASSAYDEKSGVLFYSLVTKNAIGCWNTRKYSFYSGSINDVVASNDETMIYFSDIKVDSSSTLWAISNRLPVILYGKYSPDEYNFRIFSARVQHLIKNTLCEQSRQFWSRKF